MVKYIFWAHSIKGLLEDIELMSHNYLKAKNRVLKYIVTNQVSKHPVRRVIS